VGIKKERKQTGETIQREKEKKTRDASAVTSEVASQSRQDEDGVVAAGS
jgi:hypothetical protein